MTPSTGLQVPPGSPGTVPAPPAGTGLPANGPALGPAGAASGSAVIGAGTCYVLFAYDIGFSINLDHAERLVTEATAREVFKHRRRAPKHFEFRPAPLRVLQTGDPLQLTVDRGGAAGPGTAWATDGTVECVLYDFGAVSVSYAIQLGQGTGGPRDLDGLLQLSDLLYDHAGLLADSRRRVDRLLEAIGPAVTKPRLSELVEDYIIYQVHELEPAAPAGAAPGAATAQPTFPAAWVERNAPRLAQILRSEPMPLSSQEIAESMAARAAYSPLDEAIIDWNAAFLLMADAEEVRAVLEFANVELLEVRFLDDILDRTLDRGYEAMSRETIRGLLGLGGDAKHLERLARLQVDHAVLFEGVNNALKLIGDQYLARVYRLTAQRLHLPEWDASVLRKLQTIESIYEKIHDRQGNRRMELLEWIIIVLIALSIVIAFVPGLSGK